MSWHLPVDADGRRRRRTGFIGTLTEAKAEKAAAKLTSTQERVTPATMDESTIHEWFRRCFRGPWADLSPATIWQRDHSYRNFIAPTFHQLRVRDVSADDVEDWVQQLLTDHGRCRKVEAAYETLRAALGIWCKRRSIPNPVVAIDHPRGRRRGYRAKHRRLTRPQYEELKSSCATPDGLALVRLACECCLRRGELMGLQRSDFHLDASPPYVHIQRRVWDDNRKQIDIGPPKNGEERYAVIPATLAEVLRPIVADLPRADSFLFSAFGKNHAEPVRSASMQQRMARIIEKAGLVDGDGKRLTSLHGLRATGITLGAAESSVRLAQQQAGHSDSRVTQAHYLGDTELSELYQRSSFAAVFDMPFQA